jgi:2-oxoglutarate/2-oxoacid ferredoxin oxidoreductase subunit beta
MNIPAKPVPEPLPADYATDQEVRWCPGCGDFAVLAQMKKVLARLGARRENTVFISGIGCASRFPYYLDTYGMHGIHGRAPAIATGLKRMRPDLDVWVVTGDGDGLSIGVGHLVHALRRNVNIKVLLFNNRIYGLTKGQFSPTSDPGIITRSTPFGLMLEPLDPLTVALGANCSFVARAVDTQADSLGRILRRAAAHKGSAFVEIYQNCHVFNDGAFEHAKDKKTRLDHVVELEHGKPLIFGNERDKGLRQSGFGLEVVRLGDGIGEGDLVIHDEHAAAPALAQLLAAMRHPEMPEAIGVLRDVERPTQNELMAPGDGPDPSPESADLAALLAGSDSWLVE